MSDHRRTLINILEEDYVLDSDNDLFHNPNLHHIVKHQLRNHPSWCGQVNFIKEATINVENEVMNPSFFASLVQEIIDIVNKLTKNVKLPGTKLGKKTSIKNRQKLLVEQEVELLQRFLAVKLPLFVDLDHRLGRDSFEYKILAGKWNGFLWGLGSAVISLTKDDMCLNVSDTITGIDAIVDLAFASNFKVLSDQFGQRSSTMNQTIYYIAGWHNQACQKAGGRRKNNAVGRAMMRFAEMGCSSAAEATADNLPIQKVVRTQLFDGLTFPSRQYFLLIMQLEYVFVKCLSPTMLSILGSKLIINVYHAIKANQMFTECISDILEYDVDDEVLDELQMYLVRTYCRMRGKDFCRTLMQTEFSNLTLGIRPEMAVVAKMAKEKREKEKLDKKDKQQKFVKPAGNKQSDKPVGEKMTGNPAPERKKRKSKSKKDRHHSKSPKKTPSSSPKLGNTETITEGDIGKFTDYLRLDITDSPSTMVLQPRPAGGGRSRSNTEDLTMTMEGLSVQMGQSNTADNTRGELDAYQDQLFENIAEMLAEDNEENNNDNDVWNYYDDDTNHVE